MRGSRFPELIGVIHLPALAGAPGAGTLAASVALSRAGAWALREAETLKRMGFDGAILENFGDKPFYKDRVPPETVASLAVIAAAVREAVPGLVLGINVLRNDARAALALAAVSSSAFIRVNVLSGVAATDQGLIEGEAAFILRERARLGANTWIFADAHVKHARTLSSSGVDQAIEDLAHRALADAVILTGSATGKLISEETLKVSARAARACRIPLYLGSGATTENIADLAPLIDGVIVSSALRRRGRAGAELEPARVRALSAWFRSARRSSRMRK